jgi:hypothetical protein
LLATLELVCAVTTISASSAFVPRVIEVAGFRQARADGGLLS